MKNPRSDASLPEKRLDVRRCRRAARVAASTGLRGRAADALRWAPEYFGQMLCFATFVLYAATTSLRADQVEMQNGDRYLGTVLSLDTNALVLRSSVLGTVNLPRDQIALIRLGSNAATNSSRTASAIKRASVNSSAAMTNGMNDLSAPLRQLGANTNFIEQVRAQFLADAGPEANNKFSTLVSGLFSGRLTVNDIRVEAKSAADQLKELKRDLGEDAGGALDGYLSILENFLRETAPPPGTPATNVSRSPPKAKPEPAR